MWKSLTLFTIALGMALTVPVSAPVTAQGQSMSFFVSSAGSGMGGNLGGLAGADKHCQTLAAKASAGNRTWRAYLAVSPGSGAFRVRSRAFGKRRGSVAQEMSWRAQL